MALLDKAVPSETYAGQIGCFFLYGPPGVGKTELAAGAPNPIWFDFERSTDTLANSRFPKYRQIPVLRVPKDLPDMQTFIKAVKEAVKSDFETIVIDSVTRLQRYQMNEYLQVQEGAGASVLNYTKELIKSGRNHYTAQIQDWGFSTNLLDELFMTLDGCGKNIILIGHDKTDKDDLTGQIKTSFALTPALSGAIASLVSVVGYMDVKKRPGLNQPPMRILKLNPQGREVAKNRLGLMDPEIIDPTWDKIIQLVKGSK